MPFRAVVLRVFLLNVAIFLAVASSYAQVALPSESYDLNFSKGLAEYSLDRYDSAERFFRQALEAQPGDPQATFYLGQTLTRAKKYEAAESLFRKLLETDPSSGRGQLGLGIVLYNRERYRDALSSLANAEKALPNEPLVYYYQGLSHYQLAEYDQIPPRLLRALTLGPDLGPSAHYYSGLAYYERGVLEEAQAEFEAVRDVDPQSDLGKSAADYLEQIKRGVRAPGKRKIWDLTLSVSAQWDDNVVALPRGTSLRPEATGIPRQSDYSTVFFLRGEVRPFQRGLLLAGANYSFYQSLHRTLSGFDVESHTPVVFLQHTAGPVQTRLQYVLDYVQVGRSPYLVAHAFAPIVTVTEASNLFTQFQLRYQEQDYQHGRFKFNSLRDGHNWLIGATQFWLYAKNTAHVRAGYLYDNQVTGGKGVSLATIASAADWAYEGHRFLVGTTLPPMYQVRLDVGFDYYLQNYDSANSFSSGGDVFRMDQVYTYTVTASRQVAERLALALQYLHTRAESNVAAFDYNRNIYAVILTGQF